MLHTVFFIKLLLVHYTAQSPVLIEADCNLNVNVSLKCPVDDIDNMDFLSVTWYKVNHSGKAGIIRRSKGANKVQSYAFHRAADFGEKYSLLLPNVAPEDSGTYDCAISANIGHKNLNFEVILSVRECVTPTATTTVTKVSNSNQSALACRSEAEDLPIMWTVVGYVAVSIVKIILCAISIWVVHIRSSKQRQRRW